MRRILLVLLLAAPLSAQTPAAHDSVMAPINRLFDGMRAHDSTMISSAFVPGAMMLTRRPTPGGPQEVVFRSVDGFVAAAARPGEPWNEQIFDPVIEVDADLATTWIRYTFSLGETFQHCGYNAFQLVRTTDGWKISLIADTRQTEECR